jgi:hypothetical protein
LGCRLLDELQLLDLHLDFFYSHPPSNLLVQIQIWNVYLRLERIEDFPIDQGGHIKPEITAKTLFPTP